MAVAAALSLLLSSWLTSASQDRQWVRVSGVYPHLATFSDEGECGTGAVVPWADRLWVVTYSPHKPEGSADKLYEITPDLRQIVRPESLGGTPANRMVHPESRQLFIGPYVIDSDRRVRAIPYSVMYGRPTGVARHLTDPANKVVFATMEEGFYEVDVHTLAVTELWADEQRKTGRKADLPGYHGKGFYSAEGRYVYANNGDHAREALNDPTVPSGVLAEWDGRAAGWTVVRRNQFTDVTGPGGITGNPPGDDRLWTIGWDHRSLILMVLDGGLWSSFRLPKASHTYDGAHGWNTEWPRIRSIGEESLLMTMHGCFWRFPSTFSAANTAGIAPRSTYLKVIGDFCDWNGRVVFGCDDTAKSEFLNKHPLKGNLAPPGKSQSNLWFVDHPKLDSFGPALGRGGVWLDEDVTEAVPTEPYLFCGYDHRSLFLAHKSPQAITFCLEVDSQGHGEWRKLREVIVSAAGGCWVEFEPSERGAWIRLSTRENASGVSASFHYRDQDKRALNASEMFSGLARPGQTRVNGGLLYARGAEFRTLRFLAHDARGELGCYALDASLQLHSVHDPQGAEWMTKNVAIPPARITTDAASVLYRDDRGQRWRLPKGDPSFDQPGVLGAERTCREVCTERNLLNAHGTFYEMPAENAGGFPKIRPIATHNRHIVDFASYRGMVVLSGMADPQPGRSAATAASSNEHEIRSADSKCALWVGVVDDLWNLGKPRGVGGPWKNSHVIANEPSDPYLVTGYDHKSVTLSHSGNTPARMRLEADISGSGHWVAYREFLVEPGRNLHHTFPDAFGAYWVRLVCDTATTATAQFVYE